MFELIRDNRSGSRLELVVFTLNEERRIRQILGCYGGSCDVVLLDGGSSDGTVEAALAAKATVFRRLGGAVGEEYLAHYVNDVTSSGLCFYMLADEFIAPSDLAAVEAELRERSSAVSCRKSEWFYGRRMLTFDHIEPRGFRRGCARYVEVLHANLQAVALPDAPACERLFPLQHLHIWSVQGSFGKIGVYTVTEAGEFRRSGRQGRRFFRRYVASWIGFPLIKAWRERGMGLPRAAFWSLFDLAEMVIAALAWIEGSFLMSADEQWAQYSTFYERAGGTAVPQGEAR